MGTTRRQQRQRGGGGSSGGGWTEAGRMRSVVGCGDDVVARGDDCVRRTRGRVATDPGSASYAFSNSSIASTATSNSHSRKSHDSGTCGGGCDGVRRTYSSRIPRIRGWGSSSWSWSWRRRREHGVRQQRKERVLATRALRIMAAVLLALCIGGARLPGAAAMRTCSPTSLGELKLFLESSDCEAFGLVAVDLSATTQEEAQELVPVLAGSEHLTALSLVRTSSNGNIVHMIAAALQQGAKLQVLDLSHNPLDEDAVNTLSQGIKTSKHLWRINMVNCHLDDDAVTMLSIAISDAPKPLTHLNLFHNGITARGASLLASALAGRRRVEFLDLGMNPLGDEGVGALSSLLDSCPALSMLSISGVEATVRGARLLARSLGASHLKHLSFSKNYGLGPDGGKAFGQGLQTVTQLEYLDLSMCNLGNLGVAAVLDGLRESKALKRLLLALNDLTPDTALAPFVTTHPALEVVDLSHNRFDDAWCMGFYSSLQTSACFFKTSLRALRLSHTGVTQACLDKLQHIYDGLPCTAHGMAMHEGAQAAMQGYCAEGDTECTDATLPSDGYRLVQTELVALLARSRLEDCLLPLSRAGVTTKEHLKARCCGKRRSCREKMELPLKTKAERQRWEATLDTICHEI